MVPPMSTTTASPRCSTRPDGGVMRAGRVRARGHDREVGPGVALGHDRVGDVGGHLQLGAAGPQPARHPGVHPVDGRARRAQRLDLGRALARAQPAAARCWPAPAGRRAARRAAAAPSAPTSGPTARPPRACPAAAATSSYGSSVSSQPMISRPSPPAGEASAAGCSSSGTSRNGSPASAAGTARQVSRSSGVRVVADRRSAGPRPASAAGRPGPPSRAAAADLREPARRVQLAARLCPVRHWHLQSPLTAPRQSEPPAASSHGR